MWKGKLNAPISFSADNQNIFRDWVFKLMPLKMKESLSWRIIIFPSGKHYLSFFRGFFIGPRPCKKVLFFLPLYTEFP